MYEKDIKHHELLFTDSSWKIGIVHWHLLKASDQLYKLSTTYYKIKIGDQELEQPKDTEFGEEVEHDPIHWWIFKKEPDFKVLKEKTDKTLNAVQTLKKESNKLKDQFDVTSYKELIEKIKNFTEANKNQIDILYDFVKWLDEKDKLAPSMLLTYRVWGSTRIGDRWIEIKEDNLNKHINIVNQCTEIALGLRHRGFKYTIYEIHMELSAKIADSIDPSEYDGPIYVPKDRLYIHTARKVFDELAIYFEFIRNSLRNILLDIEKYDVQTNLIYKESFWEKFVKKAIANNKIENKLWDFKETFEMWHNKKEEKFKIKFCELIAAFANNSGGALIIGITDSLPRKIVGVEDLENRIKLCQSTINKYIKYDNSLVEFIQIQLNKEEINKKNCLIIAVKQTKKVVAVRDGTNRFSFPIRSGTGLDRIEQEDIDRSKSLINHDNFDFVLNLQAFSK